MGKYYLSIVQILLEHEKINLIYLPVTQTWNMGIECTSWVSYSANAICAKLILSITLLDRFYVVYVLMSYALHYFNWIKYY